MLLTKTCLVFSIFTLLTIRTTGSSESAASLEPAEVVPSRPPLFTVDLPSSAEGGASSSETSGGVVFTGAPSDSASASLENTADSEVSDGGSPDGWQPAKAVMLESTDGETVGENALKIESTGGAVARAANALQWVRELLQPLVVLLRKTVRGMRAWQPSVLATADDRGVLMAALTLVAGVGFLASWLAQSYGTERSQLDRRAFANALAQQKALKLDNERLCKSVDERAADEAALRLLRETHAGCEESERALLAELDALRRQLADGDVAREAADERVRQAERATDDANDALAAANRTLDELRQAGKDSREQLNEYRMSCEAARDKAARLECELAERLAEGKQLAASERLLQSQLAQLSSDLERKRAEAEAATQRNADLEVQLSGLQAIVGDLQSADRDATSAADTNGWSEVTDWDEEKTRRMSRATSPPVASPSEMVDAAKLRHQLKLKHEELEEEQRIIERMSTAAADADGRLTEARRNLDETKAKLDGAEAERRELVAQNRHCLAMLEGKERECAAERAAAVAAADKLAVSDGRVRDLEQCGADLQRQIAALTSKQKEMKRANEQLRMAYFHETKQLNDRLHSMQTVSSMAVAPHVQMAGSSGWADLPPLDTAAPLSDESATGSLSSRDRRRSQFASPPDADRRAAVSSDSSANDASPPPLRARAIASDFIKPKPHRKPGPPI